ncbi:uncharacterized protein C6orf136 homolog [Hemibagrus wyckioides]|uniref:uncharacterized protein C6orf136 homolog n=1 Tax=Hemibagrus wyckioides TaxID=337641 RepID=UPI00266CC12A|nr:uncharacterized protein C6orf136 homolog [Hemibagrus wyckioides]XP_058260795.1 uncharacterized protein C6orf136 homolog [Hemibagrus wyckioides]
MAVCRGGVSFWVGCIRSHGCQPLIKKQNWNVWQVVLNAPCRSLSSGSWVLAPPNSLHYQSVQKLSPPNPFHHVSQPREQTPEEDWEETLGMCVLLKPREAVDQHTLVEVPLFGQIKLSELLALGANRPIDFSFPLTTVDGRREDDISVTAKSRTEQNPDLEQSSFRSLFQAEGCPAPFMLGSCFYCFHCPGTAPVAEAGDKLRIGHVFFPRSFSALSSDTETVSMDRGSSEKDNENEEKLALMYEKLRIELPRFFLKNHDYSMYSNNMEFINDLLNMKTRGRVAYQLTLALWRLMCLCYYADARLEVLKLTKHPEDGSIKARWRVKGLPFHTLLLRFYKKDKSQFYRTFDAFSTFYLGSDGLIHCHKVEKVMQAQPPVLPKVTSLLAGALVALGLQEDRPALNLLPMFLSSFRQAQD